MIATNEDGFVVLAAINQQIKRAFRIRPAVDIISQENVDDALSVLLRDIVVDGRKSLFEQICTAVDVANGIDANPGRSACPFLKFFYPPLEHVLPL
jgi:hypothetical protein